MDKIKDKIYQVFKISSPDGKEAPSQPRKELQSSTPGGPKVLPPLPSSPSNAIDIAPGCGPRLEVAHDSAERALPRVFDGLLIAYTCPPRLDRRAVSTNGLEKIEPQTLIGNPKLYPPGTELVIRPRKGVLDHIKDRKAEGTLAVIQRRSRDYHGVGGPRLDCVLSDRLAGESGRLSSRNWPNGYSFSFGAKDGSRYEFYVRHRPCARLGPEELLEIEAGDRLSLTGRQNRWKSAPDREICPGADESCEFAEVLERDSKGGSLQFTLKTIWSPTHRYVGHPGIQVELPRKDRKAARDPDDKASLHGPLEWTLDVARNPGVEIRRDKRFRAAVPDSAFSETCEGAPVLLTSMKSGEGFTVDFVSVNEVDEKRIWVRAPLRMKGDRGTSLDDVAIRRQSDPEVQSQWRFLISLADFEVRDPEWKLEAFREIDPSSLTFRDSAAIRSKETGEVFDVSFAPQAWGDKTVICVSALSDLRGDRGTSLKEVATQASKNRFDETMSLYQVPLELFQVGTRLK